jgi:hypothetical protein
MMNAFAGPTALQEKAWFWLFHDHGGQSRAPAMVQPATISEPYERDWGNPARAFERLMPENAVMVASKNSCGNSYFQGTKAPVQTARAPEGRAT